MEEDSNRVYQWVKGAGCAPSGGGEIHPQARVEQTASAWSKVWNPETLPSEDALLRWVPAEVSPADVPVFTAAGFRKAFSKARRKAAGKDVAPAVLCDHCECVYQPLARVWSGILDGGGAL